MPNSNETPWPETGDDAFGTGSSDDWRSPTVVQLDWFSVLGDDSTIAQGFREAADKVVEDLATGNSLFHPDRFLFPVAYLYRHSLELMLKGLICDGVRLEIIQRDSRLEEKLRGHNLHQLWNVSRQVLEAFWPNSDKRDLVATETTVLNFHALDSSGQAFRYARDRNDRKQLGAAPPRIDLVQLRRVMGGVFNLLDGCSTSLGDAIDTLDSAGRETW